MRPTPMRSCPWLVAVVYALIGSGQAGAQVAPPITLPEALRLADLGLQRIAAADKAAPAAKLTSSSAKAAVPGKSVEVSRTNGLTYKSPNGMLKLDFGGRLHLDAGIENLGGGTTVDGTSGRGPLVRRAYLEFGADYDDRWGLQFQYDLADRRKPIKDATVGYSGVAPFAFTLGNFKEPFSLDQLTSDNTTVFMERSVGDSIVTMRSTGVAASAHGKRWTIVAGLFGGDINDGVTGSGIAATARLTFAPILDDHHVLYLSVAASQRQPNRNTSIDLGITPESALLDTPVLSRPLTNIGGLTRLGLEAAYQQGPVRVQSEYMIVWTDRAGGRPVGLFQGGYVFASVSPSGHSRPYDVVPSPVSVVSIRRNQMPSMESMSRIISLHSSSRRAPVYQTRIRR